MYGYSKLRGSVKWQVIEVFKTIKHLNKSRHSSKHQVIDRLQSEKKSISRHTIAKKMGIHSFATHSEYLKTSQQAFQYIKSNFGVKDITKIEGEHIQAFLEAKITDGIKLSSFRTYAAALQKLEVALSRYSEKQHLETTYHFSECIKNVAEDASNVLQREQVARAYDDPKLIINRLESPDHQLAAKIQLEGGNRICEVGHIRENQLKGTSKHDVRGDVGRVDLTKANTKGGKPRSIYLSPETYSTLKDRIVSDTNKEFRLTSKDAYRAELKQAAEKLNQRYTGSHGLRWNFAQKATNQYQKNGFTYEQALAKVSKDMGHVRADITEHYLR